MRFFQDATAHWLRECFPPEAATDNVERCDRFLEEAIEFTQACGHSPERAHALVNYVHDRPAGESGQELGGVMVTLAALANAFGLSIAREAWREIDRVRDPATMLKIREKQAAKPVGSALPIAVPDGPSTQTLTLAMKLPVRPELAAFSLIQERRLQDNEHKGGWQNDPAILLFATLLREVGRLEDAIQNLMADGVRNLDENRNAVITEAADVANMAMMIADVVGGLRAPTSEGEAS